MCVARRAQPWDIDSPIDFKLLPGGKFAWHPIGCFPYNGILLIHKARIDGVESQV